MVDALGEELTYPDGLYQYIYMICFIHPIPIALAFYYEMYFSGLTGIILFMTSTNYWKKPYKKSIARILDMTCVNIFVPYHYYLAFSINNKILCLSLMSTGIMLYPISNYLQQPKNYYWSVACHCLMHCFIASSSCILFKDYYEINQLQYMSQTQYITQTQYMSQSHQIEL
jgi:hypothetical protein